MSKVFDEAVVLDQTAAPASSCLAHPLQIAAESDQGISRGPILEADSVEDRVRRSNAQLAEDTLQLMVRQHFCEAAIHDLTGLPETKWQYHQSFIVPVCLDCP